MWEGEGEGVNKIPLLDLSLFKAKTQIMGTLENVYELFGGNKCLKLKNNKKTNRPLCYNHNKVKNKIIQISY